MRYSFVTSAKFPSGTKPKHTEDLPVTVRCQLQCVVHWNCHWIQHFRRAWNPVKLVKLDRHFPWSMDGVESLYPSSVLAPSSDALCS